eukprot:scaffold301_cov243-Pinguiococcus_pyrenoidosus.AAC.33
MERRRRRPPRPDELSEGEGRPPLSREHVVRPSRVMSSVPLSPWFRGVVALRGPGCPKPTPEPPKPKNE